MSSPDGLGRSPRPQDGWYSTDAISRRLVAASGSIVMTMLAIIQISSFSSVLVTPLITLVTLVSSLYLSVRSTIFMGIYAVLLAFLVGVSSNGTLFETTDFFRIFTASCVCGFAAINASVRRRREATVIQFSEVASVAQSTIIRPLPANIGPAGLASRYLSAHAGALVGGDFYAAVPIHDGVRLLVGDVRGKGLPAVQAAATALWTFRAVASRDSTDLNIVGNEVERAVEQEFSDEDFATAVFSQIDANGTLHMVNYGHPSPLLIRRNGEVIALDAPDPAPPLGLAMGMKPRARIEHLDAGDRIIMFTDGLIEARDDQGRFFPLVDIVPELRGKSPQEALDYVLEAVSTHTGDGLNDDLALVLVEMSANGTVQQLIPPTSVTLPLS